MNGIAARKNLKNVRPVKTGNGKSQKKKPNETRRKAEEGGLREMTYPIYIAIPHQASATQWYANDEPLKDNDMYIAGDHDLHRIIRIDDRLELEHISKAYTGHQELKVRSIASELLDQED